MFNPPIDLSNLPGYEAARQPAQVRTAFLGRCSTKENQDFRASIAGQLAESSALLEPGQEFTGFYWDVESGMLGLDERGQGTDVDYAALGVPVRRDGGLRELLEAVECGEIDRVVCERISRVARDMLASLTVEAHLKRRGVLLLAANEPNSGGMTTGQLGLRRFGQVQAEMARHELMEMSLRGQNQHAANGYQHGPPCHGYIAVVDPTAPPAANRFGGGRAKRRLALNPDERFPATVGEAFRLRLHERASDAEINAHLAADLDRYPPGEGRIWRPARVRRMLAQPKYTGFMVYNRRASRTGGGRPNPITDWVWSHQPAHPAIIPLEEWYDTQMVTARMRKRLTPAWERIRAAADTRGLALNLVRQSDTHAVYEIGGRQIVLPCGELPAAVADAVLTLLEEQ